MIEFRKGEKYCHWNGILMTPEKCKELFGVKSEVYFGKGVVYYNNVFYTLLPFGKLVEYIAKNFGGKVCGKVPPCRVNFAEWQARKEMEDSFIIPKKAVKNAVIRLPGAFYDDYPNFDLKKYKKFYKELDEYYDKMDIAWRGEGTEI